MSGPRRVVADRRGFALLVVIVVLLLVSLLASQLIMEVRTELRTAANSRELAGGRLLAEGGINIALFRLLDKPELGMEPEEFGGAKFFLGRKYETVLPAGKIEYYALDESGKINLNAGTVGLLSLFLEYHGLKPEEIAVVLDSLQDWRDPDNLTRLNGAESEYYEKLVPPYTPRNGPFADPAEFFLLKGTEALRGRFDPYEVFTVYSTGTRLYLDSLPKPLVEFFFEGDPAKVEQYQQLKNENGKVSVAQVLQLLGSERFELLKNYMSVVQNANPVYAIVGRGWAGKGSDSALAADGVEATPVDDAKSGAQVRVLVKLAKDGFEYLFWKEGYL